MDRAWGPNLNSPHASISLRKEKSDTGPVVKYRLYATGLPRQSKYSLVTWPVTQLGPSTGLEGVTLNESGLAICAGLAGTCGSADKPNDPIDLTFIPVKGEPFRVALISASDPKLKAFLKIVPIPNEAKDKGCSIQAVLLLPGAVEVAIEGSGFPPNAALTLETNSEGEQHSGTGKTDSNGNYFSVILPYVQGMQRGTAHVKLNAAECQPALSFQWGK